MGETIRTSDPAFIEQKSRLTGDIIDDPSPLVRFVGLGGRWARFGILLIALTACAFCASFFIFLVRSAFSNETLTTNVFSNTWWLALLFALVALGNELIRSPLILTLAYTAVMSSKPVPVVPNEARRSILIMPFVSAKEDINRLERSLKAAKKVNGLDAIMVLDEGLDPVIMPDGTEIPVASPVKPLVELLNELYDGPPIHYFSRREHRIYNDETRKGNRSGPQRKQKYGYIKKRGKFKRKQKYGNINAGLDHLRRNAGIYGTFDIIMGIDHDHIVIPGFRDRLVGYFNDPDVAYVVAPQSYENAQWNPVAHLAESCQSPFNIQIQAAPNRAGGPMFVGTNWAFRGTALRQIGDIQASKTEDLKTTLVVLSRRNPLTKNYWRGVYTPDVLAHGEGPTSFGDYYIQQGRWAAGAMEFIRSWSFWLCLLRMWRRPRVLFHYLSIMAFYPIMGLSWLLAAANIGLQMVLGANGQIVDPGDWLLFYGWTTFMSVTLYGLMRRYNTSPFERKGWGMVGMFMGVMTVPLFASTLIKTILFIPNKKFQVTPKGAKSTGDRLFTFRLNLGWAVYYAAMILAGFASHNLNPINLTWSLFALVILMAPIVIWKATTKAEQPEVDDNSTGTLESKLADLGFSDIIPADITGLLNESEA